LDAASAPKARLWIQGKTPKTKVAQLAFAAGVFSETSDYIERSETRLENFYAEVVGALSRLYGGFYGQRRRPDSCKVVKGGADAEK
jgi:hypothetical protein